ncbi:SixA phosphatase family protein [Arsenicicoccus sp. oral taxon 190]|uniref:SixA phosphatase family protein n=1 Tax=Arsenicicoccus sp. oral taxon 190 TaxID=1658671 RepID=UPI00067A2D03|nr:histidine phosphatase family protein [Arsenicicoccus sp. oral taxon 190]AKT52316.1 hypothetical protein ADJ73_15405 [Arsenicicoccus sp. oral taxon 190]
MTNPQRTLVLMRHAEAGHGAGGDHDRPLTSQGRSDARAAGRWLAEEVGELDLVLVSSARRTRETWREAADAGAAARDVQASDEVYDAGLDELLAAVSHLPDKARAVLVLGHAPGIPMLAHVLASADGPADVREALDHGFPTATICRFGVERDWLDVGAATIDLLQVTIPRG